MTRIVENRIGEHWCESCKWWGGERAHRDAAPYGSCRARPPERGTVKSLPYYDADRPDAPGPIVEIGTWPWTAFDDWCAKHSSKAAEEPK